MVKVIGQSSRTQLEKNLQEETFSIMHARFKARVVRQKHDRLKNKFELETVNKQQSGRCDLE